MNENAVTTKTKTTTTNTVITAQLAAYAVYLREEEHSRGTIEKYLRDVRTFAQWLSVRELTKETAVEWKEQREGLRTRHHQFHALRAQRLFHVHRARGLPCEVSQDTAADVPRGVEGTDT